MKVTTEFKRIFRPAGGLFLGLRIHMPCSIVDVDENTPAGAPCQHWTQITASIGLVFWCWVFNFNYNHWTDQP